MSNVPNSGMVTFDTIETVVIDAAVVISPISNSSLLFQGDYTRLGEDLVISHEEHGSLRITNYFSQSAPPDLFSAGGAIVDGATVARLAGIQAPGQYAQAGTGLAGTPIGTVQSAAGTVTAQRTDGTSVTLVSGDPVFQGDVVQTAGGSSLVIVFVDETLFSLSADARMVLDELVYSPNGSGNSMVMNLVQGSFVFVTGQVAPTGDMRIETPTATMGIRGTTPIVQISALDGSTRFSLSEDPSGLLGSYQLFDRISGQLLGTVNSTDATFLVASIGASPIVTPKSQSDIDAEQSILQRAFDAYRASGLGQSTDNDGDGNPDQTDAGPPDGIQNPDIAPLGPDGGDGDEGDGLGSDDRSGLDLLDPSNQNASDPFQYAGGTSYQSQTSGEQTAAPDDLLVILPASVMAMEDMSIFLTGLNIEIPGDGEGAVTIVARSTVTLAQTDGLTFVTGDGFEDEIVSFIGSEEDINAALSGMQYTPSENSEVGGLNITLYDGTSTVEADLPITIQPVEDPPVVFDLTLTVDEDGNITAPFVGSDPDSGDTISLYALTEPELGTLEVHDDGTFTFDTDGAFESLSANSSQQVTFEYTAIDSTGRVSTNSGLVTITVTGVNDAPEVEATQPTGFSEVADASEQQLLDSGSVAVSDVDQGDSVTVTYAVDGAPVWSGGNLDDISSELAAALLAGFRLSGTDTGLDTEFVLQGTGQYEIEWLYDVTADLDFMAAGDTITFSFVITVEDLAGETSTEVVTFTISGTEDAPVITGTASGSVSEDGIASVSDILFVSDADQIDAPVFVEQTATSGSYGTFDITTGGEWVYVLDNAAAQALAGGEVATETFAVEGVTADGESVTQIVTITVTGQEDAPVITGTASGAVFEDGSQSATGSLSVTDADTADTPTFTAQSGVAGAFGSFAVTTIGDWTYTLDNAAAQVLAGGEVATETFTVNAVTADGESVSQIVTITVTGQEDGPVITGTASGAVAEDGVFFATGSLSVSDVDAADTPTFTAQIGTAGSWGVFDVTTGGAWTYTLDNAGAQSLAGGEVVTETFTVEATTADGESVTQTVTVTVTGTEDAPVISGTSGGAVAEDGTLSATGALTATDADTADTPTFIAQNSTAGTYGIFELTAGGAWTYTLDNSAAQPLSGGEVATETFTVEAVTADGESVTQTVTIIVTGAEDGPVIIGTSSGAVAEDGTLVATGALSVSDTDAADTPTFVEQTGTTGGYGTFQVTITGDWTYTLDNVAAQALAGGEIATETFSVEAVTADGESVVQTVTITVTGEEDAPVITGTAGGSVSEDGTLNASGVLAVTDADAVDAPVFTAQVATAGSYGTFAVTAGGDWTYTLDNAAAQALAGGEVATETFITEATTSDGESVSQSVTVTVTGQEDAPVISGTSSGAVSEDGVLSAAGSLTATDADSADTPTFVAQAGTAGAWGVFDVTTGGAWTYTLDNAAAQALAGGEVATETFTVEATTSDGESVSQIVTVTVTGAEDAPVITGTSSGAVAEDGTLSASGALSVSDADAADTPSFTAQSGTSGSYGTFAVTTGGAWTYTLDNAAAQALAGGEVATETFVVEATTTDGESVSQSVVITVTGQEDAPVITGLASGAVTEDGTLSATGTLSVSDADAADIPTFTAQAGTAGAWGVFDVTTGGAWTYTLDNATAQALAGGEVVTETFTVEATTADGEEVSQTVTISVTGQEDAPVISGTSSGAVTEDGTLSASGALTVTDADAADTPVFVEQVATAGTYGTFSVTTGGAWTYTLDNAAAQALAGGEVATETFTVEAVTADGESVSQTVTVTVTGDEDTSVITGTSTGAVAEDGVLVATGELTVEDSDASDSPVFVEQTATAGTYGTFGITTGGDWTYALDNAVAQALSGGELVTETFTVEATTADGELVSKSVIITVTGQEDDPVITGSASGAVFEDGTLSASGALTVTDADAADTPIFTSQAGTTGSYGIFDVTTGGAWTYTLDNAAAQALAGGEVATETFTVEATTADGESVTQTVTITVTGAEDAPVITGTSSGAVAEDGTLSASGALSVSDADAADTPSFTAQSGTSGSYGTFAVTTGGAWTYTLDNAAAQALAGGEVATETFTVEATTTDGESVSQTVVITVTGQEDAPVISGTSGGAVTEDGTLSATGTLSVSDADAADIPTFTAQAGTAGAWGVFDVTTGGAWTYTLDNAAAQALAGGEVVTETFTVEATTADGEEVSQTVTISVTGQEDAPVISGTSSGAVTEDGTLSASGALTVSDADAADTPTFVEQVATAGTYGTFSVTTGGAWTYTLDNAAAQALAGGEVATETFTVEAVTADGESVSQTVTVTVTGDEDTSVITGTSTGAVAEDGVLVATGELTVEDSDASDSPVFVEQTATAGTYGTFGITTGGDWTYALDNAVAQALSGGELVTETFTVEATTADGELVSKSVIITVTGQEDDPVITGTASGAVFEDGTLSVSGALTVTDADAADTPIFTSQAGTTGSYGIFDVTTGGAWTYTLDNAAAQALAGGEVVTETFTVEATTSDGESVSQIVTVTVTGAEDAPVIIGTSSGSVAEDGTLSATGTLSVSDADSPDTPTFVAQTETTGALGTFTVTASGDWTYTLDNAVAQALAGGEVATETFTVEATTADGESVVQTVTITVTGEEDAPVISGTSNGAVSEDGVLSTTGSLTVTDADSADTPTFVAQTGTAGILGIFDVTTGGAWTYTLDNAAAQALAGGEVATETFTVEATTADGEEVSQTITITVTGAEDAPVITGTSSGAVAEDGTLSASGSLAVTDADANDTPVFTVQTGTTGTYGTFEITIDGDWIYTLDNTAAQVLAGGEIATETFTVEAVTADGEEVNQAITITVTGAEDAPVITGTASGAVAEDGTLSASGALSVSDADAADTPSFTAQSGTSGSYGTFGITTGGAWTYSLDNAIAQTLAGGEVATETFVVEATTADGESVTQTVTVTVTGAEDGPVITGTAAGAVTEDGTLSATGTLSVSDADSPDTPAFVVQTGTAGSFGLFKLAATGVWTYELDNEAAQELAGGEVVTETFTVTANTIDGESVSQTVLITVTGNEDAPIITGTASGSVAEDGTQSTAGALAVTDADAADTPTFTAQNDTAGAYGLFNVTSGGNWTYTLDNGAAQALAGGEVATETFTVEATTADGESVSQSVVITVAGQEDAPVITGTASGAVFEDGTLIAAGALTASDPDANDTPVFTAQTGTEGVYGLFDVTSGGDWTYTLDNDAAQALERGQTVTETFTVLATTADGESVEQTISVTVTGTNEPPDVEDVVLVANLTNNSGFENGFFDWQQITGPQIGPNGEEIVNSYEHSFTIDETGELIAGDDYVADISFSGWLDQWNDGPDRGTVFGPSLISNEFAGYAGDIVTFVYRPFAGDDAASITAELINVDTGERILVFFEETPRGGSSDVKYIDVPISETGNFRIEFKIGSFDSTDGGLVGARLAIGTAGIIRKGVLAGDSQTFEPIQFLENASDPEGDTISLYSVASTSTYGATVSLVDGEVVYDTGNAFDFLAEGQMITDTFEFTVSDGNGGFTTATASIDVVGTGEGGAGAAMTYAPVADQADTAQQNNDPAPLAATGSAVAVNEPLPEETVTYAFPSTGQETSGLSTYSTAQQAAAIAALSLWAEISGLTITEAGEGETATIRFLNSTSVSYAQTFDANGGSTILTNPDYLETLSPGSGTYGFLTLLHETGHALGLEHAPEGVTQAQSVMSSQSPDVLGIDWYNDAGVWVYAQTPMIEDIAAVQKIYGSNPATRSGDTVYGFGSTETGSIYDFSVNTDPVLTIYDAAGVDALDFSGWDAPAIINLNPGSYSSVNGMSSNIGLAFGTIIEKAIGGAGDDVLIGTARAETLDGGAGRDELTGGAGADTFVLSHTDLADVIVDFEIGVDRLDLQALLIANFGADDVEDFIQTTRDGADVIVSVDRDGSGKSSGFEDVAVLQSVEAGGIIDFVFSDNGVQTTETVVA